VGLVRLRRDAVGEGQRLAFAAPPLRRSGPVDAADLAQIVRALRIEASDVVRSAWVDNGPGWVAVQLRDADTVLALEPDLVAVGDLKLGVVGEYGRAGAGAGAAGPGADAPAVEVRAFVPSIGVGEDPVTGSLNAGLGQWLAGDVLPSSYVASQGTVLGRTGRVHVEKGPDGEVWVGGATGTTIVGQVAF
jgi:PhzF family phenazine biosynthesis protein